MPNALAVAEQADGARFNRAALASDVRSSLIERFREVRIFRNALCETLSPEDYVVQSMPDVSPTKWHLAHTSWFFETFVLKVWMPRYRSEVPQYAYLFNSYYNAAGDMHRRDLRGLISRPTVAETFRFRKSIDQCVCELLENADDALLAEIEPFLCSVCITSNSIRNCSSPTSSTSSRKIRFIPSFGKRRKATQRRSRRRISSNSTKRPL